jgi:c-di-AMP phosphodiesterase-like protein
MEYNFSGQISFDDFFKFHQFNIMAVINKIFPKKGKYFVVLSLIAYFIIDLRRDFSFSKIIIWLIVILIFVCPWVIIYYSKGLYKKLYNNDKSNIELCNYKINENSINIIFNSGIINIEKNNVHKILYDDDSIYIYQEPNMAKIIKKRFFDDENEFSSLLVFIKNEYMK